MVLTLDKYVDIRHLHGNFLNRLLYLNQKPFQALSPFVLDYRVLDLDRGLWINHIPKLSTLAAELRSVNLHELGNEYWWCSNLLSQLSPHLSAPQSHTQGYS